MCTEKYINPFTDFGFKRLFGSEANKASLISMLNSILDEPDPITDISYIPTEHLGMGQGSRYAVFDIYCQTDSGSHIIVEMQNMYQRFYKDRSVFYSTFPIQEAAKKGKWDYRLPRVYTVSFLNFCMDELMGSPDVRSVVKLCNLADGSVFYDGLTYVYLELPKFVKGLDELRSPLDKWLYGLKNLDQLEEVPAELQGAIFTSFFESAEVGRFNPQERMAYEESLKTLRDNENVLTTAIEDSLQKGREEGREEGLAEGHKAGLEEGLEKGLEKGREEGMREMVRSMMARGLNLESISNLTGLPRDLLNSL